MNRALTVPLLLHLAAVAVAQQATAPASHPAATPWQQALAAARAHKAPIFAFVLPPADERAGETPCKATLAAEQQMGLLWRMRQDVPPIATARDLLLRQVQMLRVGTGPRSRVPAPMPPTESQAILALCEPVFASASECGARPGETVVLCGSGGERVRGFALDLLDRGAFVRDVGGAVLGTEALLPRASNVAPGLRKDLARLRELRADARPGEAAIAEAQQIERRLGAALPALAPALVHRGDEGLAIDPELAAFESARAPFGSEAHVLAGDPCPACGMAYVPPELQAVLKLIGP
ncbi:MAG TPA: hypothetical protein VFZ65_08035 [Planctomycetota bacterium]|nr:hypothetical protein [Planctomycetota bacterium]